MKITFITSLLFVCVTCYNDYTSKRRLLLKAEMYNSLGGNLILTDKEKQVNKCLMEHKVKEIDYAFDNPRYFNFSHHYFSFKNKMKESKVYKIIQRMPKGAALHLHDIALLGPDYMVNITYMDHLYVCFNQDAIDFKFSNSLPTTNCDRWQLMSQVRFEAKNVTEFDANLRKHFRMVNDDPNAHQSEAESWAKFYGYFRIVRPLFTHRPVFEQYIYDALKRFKEDNILYLEVRTALTPLYELNGTRHSQQMTARYYDGVIKRFVRDFPDFVGAKFIVATSWNDSKEVADYIQVTREVKAETPDTFAGFDLVGQEDLKTPLKEFASELLKARDINFFFHAGETDWYGTKSDENLVDAILLGSKRIGHGYALVKHPLLMRQVIEKDIGIEVNVISNQVLSLVKDLRNHPLNIFLANGLPVVLSSDDPGAWEAEPLSDDFYVAFVGASSKHSDLALLKTLALNSLKYSALDEIKKTEAILRFNSQWSRFISYFDCSKY